MTQAESIELVTKLFASYIDSRPSEENADAYSYMLRDLDYPLARAAVQKLIATSKFLPSIAEIRAAALDEQNGPKRLGLEAWGDVTSEIRRVGAYGAPEFADEIAAECVRQMGWRRLCHGTNDAADRARFVELYEGLTQRHRQIAVSSRALSGRVGGLIKELGK